MQLSQAIRVGRELRPESHQEGHPFVHVVNPATIDLYSDVWGAAVEAVHSPIAKRSWTEASYQADMAAFVELQRQHFGNYFRTPANCPGEKARGVFAQHAKKPDQQGRYVVAREGWEMVHPVTSDCHLILNLAEFVEHAFYIHNWTSEDCAQAVEYYEQGRQVLVARSFDHYQHESVRRRTSEKLTAAAWQRELQRRAQRTGNRTYVH
jgi:hypothetical protein